jgi:replication factor C subunit 1
MDHPIPFHKATDLGKVPKRLGGGPAPDLDDVFDVSVPNIGVRHAF